MHNPWHTLTQVTLIDLDLGKCDPAPGSARDDAKLLPWRERLEAALSAVHKSIRSPTEYETSPMIAGGYGEGGGRGAALAYGLWCACMGHWGGLAWRGACVRACLIG